MKTESQKRYLVLGAVNAGIGVAITTKLIEEGHEVWGTYEPERKDAAEAAVQTFPQLKLFEVKHGSRKDLAEFVKAVSETSLNGIANSEMFFAMENPDEFDHELWDRSIQVNLTMPNFIFHELKTLLVEGASIVSITSTEGFYGSFGASAYAATKAAIHNLVKSFANTLGSRNIRVNALAAGWIGGVMDTDDVFNMSREITPLGRLGAPEEVGRAVSFLLSDQSSFITGSILTVDGGYSGVDTIVKYEFDSGRGQTS